MLRRIAVSLLAGALFFIGCSSARAPQTAPFVSSRIHVTAQGSGPDVVLVSGIDSLASEVWAGAMERVPGYRYHVVQVAGFAGFPAEGNAGDAPVIEPIAGEIARYIEDQRLEKPAIVGMSMGGSLAMLVASRHPALVSKLMVVDIVPFGGVFFGRPGAIPTPEDLRVIAGQRRDWLLAESEEARRNRNVAALAGMIRTEAARKSVLEHALMSDRTVTARAFSELITLDLRQELAQFHGPATVLYVQSPLIPLSAEATDELYARSYAALPQVKLKRIADSYHFIMLDQPERFAEELLAFLRGSA